MSEQVQLSTGVTAKYRNTEKILALAAMQDEPLFADELGNEIIYITVGVNRVLQAVHKKLLFAAAPIFEDYFKRIESTTDRIHLGDEHPAMFRLFIESVYTKRIPILHVTMCDLTRSNRLRELCQLFVFAEKFYLPHHYSNRVMDAIQDGFILSKKLPETGLIQTLYAHTGPFSKLRTFVIHCLVFGTRTKGFNCYENIGTLLQNGEIMTDFASAVQIFEAGRDPRVRDCQGEVGCTECEIFGGHTGDCGYWPCAFHIHDVVRTDVASSAPAVFHDTGCYLWSS